MCGPSTDERIIGSEKSQDSPSFFPFYPLLVGQMIEDLRRRVKFPRRSAGWQTLWAGRIACVRGS